MKEDKRNYITLRGIIVPADWDRDGEIVNLALLTDDEREFLIEKEDIIWDSLFALLREEISVTASHRLNRYSKPTIAIKTFEKIENKSVNTMLFS